MKRIDPPFSERPTDSRRQQIYATMLAPDETDSRLTVSSVGLGRPLSFQWVDAGWTAVGSLTASPDPLGIASLSIVPAAGGSITSDVLRDVPVGVILSEIRALMARAAAIEAAREKLFGDNADRSTRRGQIDDAMARPDRPRGRPQMAANELSRIAAALLDELHSEHGARGAGERARRRLGSTRGGHYPVGTFKTHVSRAEDRRFLTPGAPGGQGRAAGPAMLHEVARLCEQADGADDYVTAVAAALEISNAVAQMLVQDATRAGLLSKENP